MRKVLALCAIVLFILFARTTIVLAQEIVGYISPSELFTDKKWFGFFNKVANTESIGGNAGVNSFGVNFYVNSQTGLVPLYDSKGMTRPLVGNIQDLPRNITSNPQIANVTARVEMTNWKTGKTKMVEIFKGKQKLSPVANRELLKGIVRYNLDPRNSGVAVVRNGVTLPLDPADTAGTIKPRFPDGSFRTPFPPSAPAEPAFAPTREFQEIIRNFYKRSPTWSPEQIREFVIVSMRNYGLPVEEEFVRKALVNLLEEENLSGLTRQTLNGEKILVSEYSKLGFKTYSEYFPVQGTRGSEAKVVKVEIVDPRLYAKYEKKVRTLSKYSQDLVEQDKIMLKNSASRLTPRNFTEPFTVPRSARLAQAFGESLPVMVLECYFTIFASAVAEYKNDCDQYKQFIADNPDKVADYQKSYVDNLAQHYLNLKYTKGSLFAEYELRGFINEHPPFPWIAQEVAIPAGELRYVWDPKNPNIQAWQKELVKRIKTRANEKEMDLKKSLENNNQASSQRNVDFFSLPTNRALNPGK